MSALVGYNLCSMETTIDFRVRPFWGTGMAARAYKRNGIRRSPVAAVVPTLHLPMHGVEVKNRTPVVDIQKLRLITAIKTPYLPDGRFDLESYDSLINTQIINGVEGVIVGGTTGEGHLMSWDEHIMLIAHTVNCFGASIKVIGNTGSNSTREAVHASEQGFAVGMHAALHVNPYYGKTSLEGLASHFGAVLPMGPSIIYNVPSRTGQDIPPDVIRTISQNPNMAGVKECVGNDRVEKYTKEGIVIWSGNDDQCHDARWSHGAAGVISVVSNLIPGLMHELMFCGKNATLNSKLMSLIEWLFCESNPIGLNTALAQLGVVRPVFRLPYVPLSVSRRIEFVNIVKKLGREHFVGEKDVQVLDDAEFVLLGRNGRWRSRVAAVVPSFHLPMQSVGVKNRTPVVDIQKLRLITAIKTPYLPDGRLDLESYDSLINTQIINGVEGLIVGGTTGEGHLMSWDEHIMLIAHTVNCFGASIKVIGNTGSNSTREAIHASEQGFSVGMHAALHVNPYYGKTSLEGLASHFGAVLSMGPSIIYNVPSRTGQDIAPDVIRTISQNPNMAGVKECVGNDRVEKYTKEGIVIWSGNDDQCHDARWSHGAAGVISVVSNLIPGLMHELMFCGNNATLNSKLMPLIEWLFCEPNPIGLNTALAQLGVVRPVFRLPYVPLPVSRRIEFVNIVKKLGREHFVGEKDVHVLDDADFVLLGRY